MRSSFALWQHPQKLANRFGFSGWALGATKNCHLTLALTKLFDVHNHPFSLTYARTQFFDSPSFSTISVGLSVSDNTIFSIPLSFRQLHPLHLTQVLDGFCEFPPPSPIDAVSCKRNKN